MRALAFCALLCLPFQAMAGDFAKGLLGTWQIDKSAFIGHATMYTVFFKQGACAQVMKAVIVGTTHWATDKCTWSLEGDQMKMKITGSVTTPKTIGNRNTLTIVSVEAETASYKQEDELVTMKRVAQMPEEYAAYLKAELEKPARGDTSGEEPGGKP